MTWQLYEGDCLDIMRGLPDESVDAVITDPPYGIDYQSARRTDRAKWHKKIANDKLPYIWWLYDAYRLLKDNSPMACFCRWDVQEAFQKAIEWAGFKIKSQVIWDRTNHGMGDLSGAFAPCHDVIWFATKGDFAFKGARPQSILRSKRLDGESLDHPNEKPWYLMTQLVTPLTVTCDTILDPFAGSGTTLVAAEKLGRNSIGIEINPDYCNIIRTRMSAIQPSLFVGGA